MASTSWDPEVIKAVNEYSDTPQNKYQILAAKAAAISAAKCAAEAAKTDEDRKHEEDAKQLRKEQAIQKRIRDVIAIIDAGLEKAAEQGLTGACFKNEGYNGVNLNVYRQGVVEKAILAYYSSMNMDLHFEDHGTKYVDDIYLSVTLPNQNSKKYIDPYCKPGEIPYMSYEKYW